MIVLGLDISTSITGYCIIDTRAPMGSRLLNGGAVVTSHEKDMYTKATLAREELTQLSHAYKIDQVYVEENLQAFRRGLSSAKTLSTLARFNGIVSFLAQDIFQVPVIMLNVNHARKSIGLKIDRKIKKEVSIKEQVMNWVTEHPDFINFHWPTKIMKSGPRKGMEVTALECYDIADAAVVCFASEHT